MSDLISAFSTLDAFTLKPLLFAAANVMGSVVLVVLGALLVAWARRPEHVIERRHEGELLTWSHVGGMLGAMTMVLGIVFIVVAVLGGVHAGLGAYALRMILSDAAIVLATGITVFLMAMTSAIYNVLALYPLMMSLVAMLFLLGVIGGRQERTLTWNQGGRTLGVMLMGLFSVGMVVLGWDDVLTS